MHHTASARTAIPSGRALRPAGDPEIRCARRKWRVTAAAACLVVCILATYGNSLSGQFVFDDQFDIVENFNKRPPRPLWRVLTTTDSRGTHLHPRPVVALSFAANYRLAGFQTWTYHATNLAIHILAGLTLFGISRRTLLLAGVRPPCNFSGGRVAVPDSSCAAPRVDDDGEATWLALLIALLWGLHPLDTQAVTYMVQRYESLMGLFVLLTLYCVLRAATSQARWWQAAAVASCLLAMGSKEVAVSTPLLVLLFDRAFVSGSFREAWRQRPAMYGGLAATWLAALPLYWTHSGGGGSWAGAGVPVHWHEYALSQPAVLLHYLRLCFWPVGQCAVYDWPLAHGLAEIVPPGIAVAALLTLTLYATFRSPRWGFLGAWFFLILAPTSSILPINDLAFEHRMYLPLAAVVAATMLAVHAAWNRWLTTSIAASRLWVPLTMCVAAVLGVATFQRNKVYAGPGAFWLDVLATQPNNLRAHLSLGTALALANHPEAAIEELETALSLAPRFPEAYIAHCDLGGCFRRLGRDEEAFQHFAESVRLNNGYARGRLNLGICLAQRGRYQEACEHLQAALAIDPDLPWIRGWLGTVELRLGQLAAAEEHLSEALRMDPDQAVVHLSMGDLLLRQGKTAAAAQHYREVLRLKPDHERARHELSTLGSPPRD